MLKKQIVGKYKEKNLTYVFFQQIIKKMLYLLIILKINQSSGRLEYTLLSFT